MFDPKQYEICLEELFSLGRFGIKLGLETITAMLEGVGNPQQNLPVIHLAGTNGKGSVGATMAAVLGRAGYKTGIYTSPHLVKINERFCVDGKPVSDADVMESYLAVKNATEVPRQPTFFEYTTAMALYLFAKHRVDWAVMETGMGGRLDATNALNPKLCVITNISLEHQMYLGDTIEAIAFEKAGIIKPRTPVVTGVSQPEAREVVSRVAAENQAPLSILGKDFNVARQAEGLFDFKGLGEGISGLQTALAGPHQASNAALALAGLLVLKQQGAKISEEAIRKGLLSVRWPGRLEQVPGSPPVLLDGAHNLAAMEVLVELLQKEHPGKKWTVVTGFLDDKPFDAMLPMLAGLAGRLILTRPSIGRAVEPESFLPLLEGADLEVEILPTVPQALDRALEVGSPESPVLVAGSLYVVGEARQALEKRGRIQGDFHILAKE